MDGKSTLVFALDPSHTAMLRVCSFTLLMGFISGDLAWAARPCQTLLTSKYCTERKLLVRESLGTEQSFPKPAIGIPIKGILVKNNFYNNLLILQNVPATVWGFVLAVKSFMPVFSAVHHVFTAVAEKCLKTNGIPRKLKHKERRQRAVGAGQHRPALKFCIFLPATHTAPENPSAAQQQHTRRTSEGI